MNVKIKNFSVDITKEKVKKYSIIAGIILIIFSIGFCSGFYSGYKTRLKRIESNSNGIEQGINNIGESANRAGTQIEAGIGNLNSAGKHNDDAGRNISAASTINSELQSKFDELTTVTQTYQSSLQLANSTINDLFDLSIRRAELDEEFINSVIRVLESSKQGDSQQ